MCHLGAIAGFVAKVGRSVPAMDSSHPLVLATRYLRAASTVALESASPQSILKVRNGLTLSTCFSGMGGGEYAAYLVGIASSTQIQLLQQCDVGKEQFAALELSPLFDDRVCQFKDVCSLLEDDDREKLVRAKTYEDQVGIVQKATLRDGCACLTHRPSAAEL